MNREQVDNVTCQPNATGVSLCPFGCVDSGFQVSFTLYFLAGAFNERLLQLGTALNG
jgi:hypothetical protein